MSNYFNDPQDDQDPFNQESECPECETQMDVFDEGTYRTEYKCPRCGHRTNNDNTDELRDYLNDEA